MSNLQNEFVQFIQIMLEDEEMQKWFISLSTLSTSERTIELRNMAFKMSQSNQGDTVVKTVTSLSSDEVYDSIRAVLLAELNQNQGKT